MDMNNFNKRVDIVFMAMNEVCVNIVPMLTNMIREHGNATNREHIHGTIIHGATWIEEGDHGASCQWRTGDVLTPFRSAKHSTRTVAVLSGQARTVRGLGPDGPRPGAGARFLCLTAGRSARTQRRRKSSAAAWISLPGGTPSGRRDPR
jgi:hypothetical protein